MGFVENWVRRSVETGASHVQRTRQRAESDALLAEAQSMDDRLARAEALVDRTRYEFDRALNMLPAVFILKDAHGILLQVNRYVAEGFGLEPAEMAGRSERDFWTKEQCDIFAHDDAEVLTTHAGKVGYLEQIDCRGKVRHFRTWRMPIFNGAPNPIGVMIFAIDVAAVCSHKDESCPLHTTPPVEDRA